MSNDVTVSQDVFKEYKCSLCGCGLSVPPIRILGLERTSQRTVYKCGRCVAVKCQIGVRNEVYEAVAQQLSFPCSYPGCEEKIQWGKVQDHEQECLHRTIRCPMHYQNCNMTIAVCQVEKHFNDKHRANVREVEDIGFLSGKGDGVMLLKAGEELFFLYRLQSNNFCTSILALGPSKYKKFKLTLFSTTDTNKVSVSFDELPVIRYDERSHCFKCLRRSCEEPHHPFCNKYNAVQQMTSTGFLNVHKKELVSGVMDSKDYYRCRLTLVPSDPSVDEAPPTEEKLPTQNDTAGASSLINNESLRKALSCPICMVYMVPPIFSCPTGHTLCSICKPSLGKCPTCKATLGNTRNYLAEEMAAEVKLHCEYQVQGCAFFGIASELKIHEQDCVFRNDYDGDEPRRRSKRLKLIPL
ncbi:hypothetical protein NQ315_007271 [Exocentrus adspersus]|uniref:RING-type E3 ubiquitin transferase n=1 Tax=Exocentrus adspersus TaxID=1586481 RepID=A0AAV8WCY1_9CUCU|nr:hypothetical protein NQ315_007271 [Exocentrus adspersus]